MEIWGPKRVKAVWGDSFARSEAPWWMTSGYVRGTVSRLFVPQVCFKCSRVQSDPHKTFEQRTMTPGVVAIRTVEGWAPCSRSPQILDKSIIDKNSKQWLMQRRWTHGFSSKRLFGPLPFFAGTSLVLQSSSISTWETEILQVLNSCPQGVSLHWLDRVISAIKGAGRTYH